MKTCVRLTGSAILLTIALALPQAGIEAQTNSELLGGWIIQDWQAPAGQAGLTPQRGLFIFTQSGHYSIMYVIGEERPPLDSSPSDAAIAAAYNPFVANSGRYSVSGDEITYEAYVAKDPAYMSAFEPTGGAGNAQSMRFSIDDGVLTLRFGQGGPMQGATATLRRPGQAE
jgi:hypothetical protein